MTEPTTHTRRAAQRIEIRRVDDGVGRTKRDVVATEEPLEIRLDHAGAVNTAAVTMRTPGNDFELAAGWLYAEGIVTKREEVARIAYCVDRHLDEEQLYNVVNVHLRMDRPLDLHGLERHFFTTSACGVCGKAGIDRLAQRAGPPLSEGPTLRPEVLATLPEVLRAAQGVFEATGGLHAAGLFDATGALVALREDVGRHNALDKLVGWSLLEGRVPLSDHIVMVSGRSSFELVQKAVTAGAPVLAAVSAPSSLAVQVAETFGLTLVGFLRGPRFNVYSHPERIAV